MTNYNIFGPPFYLVAFLNLMSFITFRTISPTAPSNITFVIFSLFSRVVCIKLYANSSKFNSVQLLSCVRLFVTPWTAAHMASLSITNSRTLLKLMSIESVMPSNHLILCRPLLLLLQSFREIIFNIIYMFYNY